MDDYQYQVMLDPKKLQQWELRYFYNALKGRVPAGFLECCKISEAYRQDFPHFRQEILSIGKANNWS